MAYARWLCADPDTRGEEPLPEHTDRRVISREMLQTADNVLRAVADVFDITIEDLTGTGRHRRASHPRHIAMFVLRTLGLTYHTIGAILNRDHSTIVHGHRRIHRRHGEDVEIANQLQAVCAELGITYQTLVSARHR